MCKDFQSGFTLTLSHFWLLTGSWVFHPQKIVIIQMRIINLTEILQHNCLRLGRKARSIWICFGRFGGRSIY